MQGSHVTINQSKKDTGVIPQNHNQRTPCGKELKI